LAGDKQRNGFSERQAQWNLGIFHSTFPTNIFAWNKTHLFSQPRNDSNSRGSKGNVQTTSKLTNVKLRTLPVLSLYLLFHTTYGNIQSISFSSSTTYDKCRSSQVLHNPQGTRPRITLLMEYCLEAMTEHCNSGKSY